jgi:hypothetical protein
MAYTKYSLTPANNTAAPPDGAPEGMLPSAVNDTMRDMMAQIRDCGDGIRDGTYTMTAPKITGGTITGVALTGNTFTSPVISGGSINNTPIGATTASTGAFSTLSATGVTTVQAGTVSLPAITTTGDTNTGIFFPAADTIAFTEGGVEAMRIDSSGNVGIGTSSPACRLDLNRGSAGLLANFTDGVNTNFQIETASLLATIGPSAGSTGMAFKTGNTERMRITSGGNVLVGTTTDPAYSGHTTLVLNSATNGGVLDIQVAGSRIGSFQASGSTELRMYANTSVISTFYANASERMRIDSSGNLLVGTTSAATPTGVASKFVSQGDFTGTNFGAAISSTAATGVDHYYISFQTATTTQRGYIYYNNGAGQVQLSATSDARLKEKIVDAPLALPILTQVKVRQYDWKDTGNTNIGFVAQELYEVIPRAVSVGKDNEDGTIQRTWGVDNGTLVPYLVKAIQEQQTLIENLTTRLNALEGN